MSDTNQVQRGSFSLWCDDQGGYAELHVLPLDETQTAVIALAGGEGHSEPQRIRLQGPFPGRETALGVCNGVARALAQRGFTQRQGPARWQMIAWRERRNLLDRRAGHAPDTRFHPDDVLFWPR